jgi:hypothetical protein
MCLKSPFSAHVSCISQAGVKSFKAAKKPRITDSQRLRRLNWCKRWSPFNFKKVIFSDEKRFCRMGDGPTRVWRRQGERYVQQFMCPTTKFKGGSIMVWGCISYEGMGPLIRCSDHMNQEEYKVQGTFCFGKYSLK